MTTVLESPRAVSQAANGPPIVNDFSLQVATPNGSGSQTSNLVLLRALFKMGIPVNGKNIFPSNIQGMPTWYTIRCNRDGYVARRQRAEIVVLMNPATAAKDVAAIEAGGVCFYPDDWRIEFERSDLTYYPMPVKKLAQQADVARNLRGYIANMVYVGVVTQILGIDMAEIEAALDWQFGGRAKLVNVNLPVIQAAFDWAAENLAKADPYCVERMNGTDGLIMIDGNSAAALGAVYGGMTVAAWYPITPSTGIADSLASYAKQLRRDEDGRATYAIVQAEDELAAIGMVLGASWAGARAMTATSGPGISLMTEFVGFGYFTETPAVIWDVQRMGPSTGLPTRVSQGDIIACYWLGHGDTKHPCLFPASVAECFEFGWRAFDLADEFQTPVFVLSDLDLGMNQWISEPFAYPEEPIKRGKVLSAEQVQANGTFHRYMDVDGDGIAYRTLPGTDHPRAAYFNRGSGHDKYGHYSEDPQDWLETMERLHRKFETIRARMPAPVIEGEPGAEIGIIGFGSADPAIVEARDRMAAAGVQTRYCRLRALPVHADVRAFIEQCERVYVIEMNTDAQMQKILQLEVPQIAARVRSLAYSDGLPLTARGITESLLTAEGM